MTEGNIAKDLTVCQERDTVEVKMSHDQAMRQAIGICYPKKQPVINWSHLDEPDWANLNVFLKLTQGTNFSNYSRLQSAFSLNASFHSDIQLFRNYFAHKNEGLAKRALGISLGKYGINSKRPSLALIQRPLGQSQILIKQWTEEIYFTFELMCV